MKQISEQTTSNIITLISEGLSTRQIAHRADVGKSTVANIRRAHLPGEKTSNGGRPSKLSAREKRLIVQKITSGEYDTAADVKRMLANSHGVEVHANTVRNALKEAGMKGAVKRKKARLRADHVKARLEFARKYQDWTVKHWKRVIWSDETKINRFGSDGRKWCWRKPGSTLEPNHVQPMVKFGGGSLMIWGCMTSKGVGYACRIDGRMDAELYTKILDDELLRTVRYYRLSKDDFIFQQDNDSKHTSRLASKWFEDHRIEMLDWPVQPPDLNPIEHLWCHLKWRLSEYEEVPVSMHELWTRIEQEWNAIPVDECLKLIESMPRRISAVLRAKGKYTKY